MRQSRRSSRDPYYSWKIINMILACAVLMLATLILLGGQGGYLIPQAYFLGIVMCALSGIMELAKDKKVVGYICSISAGILGVAFLVSVIRIVW